MRSGKLVICRTKNIGAGPCMWTRIATGFLWLVVLPNAKVEDGSARGMRRPGKLSGYKSTASVRCLEADERNNELLMASDCAFVTGWNLRDPHADKNKPRFRRKIDGLPAVYTLIAADAPSALAQNADNDLAMSDDDFGADRVLISAGAAPHAVVTAKDRVLAYLQLPVPDIKPPV